MNAAAIKAARELCNALATNRVHGSTVMAFIRSAIADYMVAHCGDSLAVLALDSAVLALTGAEEGICDDDDARDEE